jgi:hypothetical protein
MIGYLCVLLVGLGVSFDVMQDWKIIQAKLWEVGIVRKFVTNGLPMNSERKLH